MITMTNSNDIGKNDRNHRNVNSSNGHIEIRGNYDSLGEIDKEDILDVMGCKTKSYIKVSIFGHFFLTKCNKNTIL